MRLLASILRFHFSLLILALMTGVMTMAQDSTDAGNGGDSPSAPQGPAAPQGPSSDTPSASTPGPSGQSQWPGHIPLPAATPDSSSDSSLQVTPPSVTLPTPALPAFTNSFPEASPTPESQQGVIPQPTPAPVFNPPSATRLNLQSAQPAGNPDFAPASVGMPSMKLDDDSSGGSGALAGMFDWAKKLRFVAAVRGGYDDNVNSANGTNAIASTYANLNGGVNYRFGSPRLNVKADLTGGVTRYFNSNIAEPLQGTVGLGLEVDYRYSPRFVFTFNSSSSYQQQPNITLAGTANNSGNSSYYYTANSFSAAYQWSDLFTTVSRFNLMASYYPDQTNNNQSFSNPGFTQSFRYLVRPTTTAVIDYNASYYSYTNSSNNSIGQSLLGGFDHVFNPKWFWNFRLGVETRQSQTTSPYFGPSLDSNLSWAFANRSSLSWVAHFGTQPSGQNNSSYSTALSSGLNYSQGIFTKLTFNVGIYYLLNQYPTFSSGPVQLPSYNTTNIQANASLAYALNRIINLSLGYQYLTLSSTSSALATEYNRGITYLQISAGL